MLQLVREIPIRTVVKTSLGRRGFLFHLAAGFSKDLDFESGITVNLVRVDAWLNELKQTLEADLGISMSPNHQEFFALQMQKAKNFLSKQAELSGAELTSLCFREERGWSFSWNKRSNQDLFFSYPFFIEAFSGAGCFELLKVKMNWRYQNDSDRDFFSEGLTILKNVSKTQDLVEFSKTNGHGEELVNGLASIEVLNLTDQYGFVVNVN